MNHARVHTLKPSTDPQSGAQTFSIPASSSRYQYEISVPSHKVEAVKAEIASGVDLQSLSKVRKIIGCGIYDAMVIASTLRQMS